MSSLKVTSEVLADIANVDRTMFPTHFLRTEKCARWVENELASGEKREVEPSVVEDLMTAGKLSEREAKLCAAVLFLADEYQKLHPNLQLGTITFYHKD